MKISQEYREIEENGVIEVVSAKYLGDYVIDLLFNDGINREINFKSFLEKSLHPSVSKYLNDELFSDFEIRNGNLNWNDYDLIFPLEDLYEGIIK